VAALSGQDLRGALAVLDAACSADGPEPFALPVVRAFARVVPGEIVGYNEQKIVTHRLLAARESPSVVVPREVRRAMLTFCGQHPLSIERRSRDTRAGKISDFVSPEELHRLDYYNEALRPIGIEHQMRLWLPAPLGIARFFSVSRRRADGDFSERDRDVLELLRPFLVALRERCDVALPCQRGGDTLTDREAEILAWVARGKTNGEIATLLLVSPHTVRKHLEHAFDKLGVHTRTAAVARAFGPVE
jgi:DNA-binding CsgD family transcriptional regulator